MVMKSSTKFMILFSFSVIITCGFMISPINADDLSLSKSDYLKWTGREVSVGWACSYYESKFTEIESLSKISSVKKYVTWVNKEYVKGEGQWEAYVQYNRNIPVYDIIEHCYEVIPNKTKGSGINVKPKIECVNVTVKNGTNNVINYRWEPYSWDRNAKKLRFCALLKPTLGFRTIDHIPTIGEYTFFKYDWWNSSINYKRPVTASTESGTCTEPILVNGTSFNLSGGYADQWVWADFGLINTTSRTVGYIYYENETDYYSVDANESDGTEVYMDVDEGTANDYGNPWDSNVLRVFHGHTNSSSDGIVDSSQNGIDGSIVSEFGTSGIYSGTYPGKTDKIGNATVFSRGNDDYIDLGTSTFDGQAAGTVMGWVHVAGSSCCRAGEGD